MQIRSYVAKWLTRGYVRILDLSGVSHEENYQAYGEERRVFWVDTDSWPMAGQCTLFGTIVLNKSKLRDVSDEVVDYVFLHEVGHAKLPTILLLGSILIRIPLMFLAILGIPSLIVRWLAFAFSSPDLRQLAIFSVATIFIILFILVPLVVVSWLDEGHAELFAVSKIGKTAYQRCLDNMKEHSNRGIFSRALRRFLYPNPNLVIRVANCQDR